MSSQLPYSRPGASTLRQRLIIAVVALLILLASAYLVLVIISRIDALFLQDVKLRGLSNLPGVQSDEEGLTGPMNILVLGLDRRPYEGDLPTRTDTIFIVRVDPQTGTARLLGIPRDLFVDIPFRDGSGTYQGRINTAYLIGEQEGYEGGGIGLLKRVIADNLGLEVDHYVIIDFDAFIELIDTLGGITITIEKDIYDPYYSHTELPGDYFPVGPYTAGQVVEMDGITALAYARTRFDSSDLERIQRQQQVIFAALEKAQQLNLFDANKLLDLWQRFKDTIETDFNDFEIAGLARQAVRFTDRSRISALSLGWTTVNYVTPDGRSVLIADPELVRQTIEAFQSDQQLILERALVEVQNGAGIDGLATQVLEHLTNLGLSPDALTAANAPDGSVRPFTEIIDFTGKQYTANRLADLLGLPAGRVRAATPDDAGLRTTEADILIVLGADAEQFVAGGNASSGG